MLYFDIFYILKCNLPYAADISCNYDMFEDLVIEYEL